MQRSKILGGAAAVVIALLAIAAWQIGLFSSDPEEANVGDLAEAVAGDETTTGAEAITDVTGTWNLVALDEVFVGYRIDEILGGVDFTAVGRTGNVEGILEGEGTTVTAVSIAADMTTLESDSGARDGQLRSQALETNDFPTATFELSEPIELGSIPGEGETVAVEAVGDLTIHGVTRSVTIPLEASTTGGTILVAGQVDVRLTDHDISTPQAPRVAGVGEVAVMEFSLAFQR